MYIHKNAHIYSAIIVCKQREGIGLLSSPGHDDAWDLLQLPQTSKVEKLKWSELRTKTLFHSPKLQTQKKGQDEHTYIR